MMKRIPSFSLFALSIVIFVLMTADVYSRFGGISALGWKQCVVWWAFLLAPAFVLGRFSRFFYVLVLFYIFLVTAVSMYIRCVFSMSIGGDWLLIVMNSNKSEILNFLRDRKSVV